MYVSLNFGYRMVNHYYTFINKIMFFKIGVYLTYILIVIFYIDYCCIWIEYDINYELFCVYFYMINSTVVIDYFVWYYCIYYIKISIKNIYCNNDEISMSIYTV